MESSYSFDEFDEKKALKYAKNHAKKDYTKELEVVLVNVLKEKRNLPSLRFPKDEEIIFEKYIERWVDAYLKGYGNRPSKRNGNKSSTFPDSLIKTILILKIPGLSTELADKLEAGHSLMMTIENMAGDLLEEYLSIKLKKLGWCCCWGSSFDAVDFCHKDGSLLQVKNSDNSENSSSVQVRKNTTIIKWARRVSTKEKQHYWDKLNSMVGSKDLSENDFIQFVSKTIQTNPKCIYLDDDNPLKN